MNFGSHYLSVSIAVLLVVYALFLIYSLVTHKKEFSSEAVRAYRWRCSSPQRSY
ncbi:Ca2+/H+ antiporter [Pseudomonas sp. 3296]|nr:Ca2+/H+ antiporter [Pseudomonas sp. 3296]